jgi:hypothetical protein
MIIVDAPLAAAAANCGRYLAIVAGLSEAKPAIAIEGRVSRDSLRSSQAASNACPRDAFGKASSPAT